MLNKETIKEIAVANGFKLKEQADGEMDLNPYVYEFTNAIAEHCWSAFKSGVMPHKIHPTKASLNNGWISVDDELPRTSTNVLVYSKLKINDELFDCVGIGYIDDDKFWQYDESFGYHHCDPYFIKEISSNDLINVQYWQPLPEPPKE